MRKLWLVVAALLLSLGPAVPQGQVGPANMILCNQVATMGIGPTTIQTLITGVAGRNINLCGWHVTNSGATGTFSITAGQQTTTPCDTNTRTIVPAMNVSNTAPSADHSGYAFFSTPSATPAYNVCVTPSVATIAVVLYYSII